MANGLVLDDVVPVLAAIGRTGIAFPLATESIPEFIDSPAPADAGRSPGLLATRTAPPVEPDEPLPPE